MNKRLVATITAAAALGGLGLAGAQPALAQQDDGSGHGRPASYALTGDPEGSRFEGIGADQRRGTFYVSEVTGGEIHRGDVRDGQTEEWLPAGADGRTTARGITDKAWLLSIRTMLFSTEADSTREAGRTSSRWNSMSSPARTGLPRGGRIHG